VEFSLDDFINLIFRSSYNTSGIYVTCHYDRKNAPKRALPKTKDQIELKLSNIVRFPVTMFFNQI